MNISDITPFDNNFYPHFMNNSFEAEKFEAEPTFENTVNEIKANHFKIITSIDINVSVITYNRPSPSSEHIKSNIISCILLQSPENHHNSPIVCIQCTLMEIPN